MTKCIVIGEQPTESKKKPIQFKKYLCSAYTFKSQCSAPKEWDNIELISRCYIDGLDLMFGYDTNRTDGILYLGHWNDGVAE